jgi:hypothetical protein
LKNLPRFFYYALTNLISQYKYYTFIESVKSVELGIYFSVCKFLRENVCLASPFVHMYMYVCVSVDLTKVTFAVL